MIHIGEQFFSFILAYILSLILLLFYSYCPFLLLFYTFTLFVPHISFCTLKPCTFLTDTFSYYLSLITYLLPLIHRASLISYLPHLIFYLLSLVPCPLSLTPPAYALGHSHTDECEQCCNER